jgi:peptidoglycan hydrolase CwlO-like protein
MTDKKISTTEAVSEFRKLMRTFEALEHAEGVLNALSEKSALERETDAKVKELYSLKEVLEKDISNLSGKVEALTGELKELTSEYNETKVAKTIEAAKIVNEAERKARDIVANAESTKDKVQGEITSLRTEKESLFGAVRTARGELDSLQKRISKEKHDLLKSLGIN